MRSLLVSFGLLSVFMLVSSLPLAPATLEKRVNLNGFSSLLPPPLSFILSDTALVLADPATPAAPAAPADRKRVE
ncbi:hypothetical protein G6F58_013754 [Rhizopus delemar]|nr:hypothetical protein G6F58_013754 [Rhizopus delemar]